MAKTRAKYKVQIYFEPQRRTQKYQIDLLRIRRGT
jgi:hypothetical protein